MRSEMLGSKTYGIKTTDKISKLVSKDIKVKDLGAT